VNSTSFFDEQERNRRATWQLSAVYVLAIRCTGAVLSLILAPPIYGFFLLALALAKRLGSLPPQAWQAVEQMGRIFLSIVQHFAEDTPLPAPGILLFAAVAVLLPGILLQLVLWTGVRGLLLRAGARGVLLTLGARPLRTEDLKAKALLMSLLACPFVVACFDRGSCFLTRRQCALWLSASCRF
jgi:hypothetical protein